MIQNIIDKAAPSSWGDTFIRALKATVAALVTGFPINALASFDVASYKIVAFSAATAGGTIILNRILSWTATT